MKTVADIIDALGGPTKFGEICGFDRHPGARGSDMRQRGSIAVRHWPAVLAAAEAKGIALTERDLVRIHNETEDVKP
jgi:hypothetical protein